MSETYDFIQTFDPVRKLQYVNGDPSVMHCHHYATLFTKLALDFADIRAPELLQTSMEEAYYLVLKKRFIIGGIETMEGKRSIIEEHFRLAGLGKVEISLHQTGGKAEMSHSHMDEGWIAKWGKRKEAVNFIGRGYLAAAFDLMFQKSLGSFTVTEDSSIVSGAPRSVFRIEMVKE